MGEKVPAEVCRALRSSEIKALKDELCNCARRNRKKIQEALQRVIDLNPYPRLADDVFFHVTVVYPGEGSTNVLFLDKVTHCILTVVQITHPGSINVFGKGRILLGKLWRLQMAKKVNSNLTVRLLPPLQVWFRLQ